MVLGYPISLILKYIVVIFKFLSATNTMINIIKFFNIEILEHGKIVL